MDQRARNFTQALGHGSFMRFVDGHCAALTIDPVARRFLCSIYPMRPDCCQALQRGSGACLSDLQEKGDRPLIAVERLLRRGSAKSAPTG